MVLTDHAVVATLMAQGPLAERSRSAIRGSACAKAALPIDGCAGHPQPFPPVKGPSYSPNRRMGNAASHVQV